MPQRVLITGAAGRIGSALVEHLDRTASAAFDLVLADLEGTGDRFVTFDITDLGACRAACEGVDAVVHLAALPSVDTPFDDLLPVNIVGTYNVFRAAADAGVARLVFASSVQAVAGYPLDVQVRTDMPVRPQNLYGVSKAYGEALGAYFAHQEGLEAIAVRIGAFEHREDWARFSARNLSAWSSPRDVCELLRLCLMADLGAEPFRIVHAISDNRFKRLDLSDTRALLGYEPQDDAFAAWGIGLADESEPSG